MRLIDGFMLREIAGVWVVVPIGERVVDFNCLINLNDSGAFLWKILERDVSFSSLVDSLLQEYDVDEGSAREDVKEFIEFLRNKGMLIN